MRLMKGIGRFFFFFEDTPLRTEPEGFMRIENIHLLVVNCRAVMEDSRYTTLKQTLIDVYLKKCVVVAILLALLCAYSLWKKRRTLCGWGFTDHHVQSEGDSAGSCYAPPQYSRCSSFHHPPPPYTEVTSKPDLYPLVFTCNSDNGKNGASYLMVQYFRNYIVRPAGSLSGTSTVDSLSSSFICNANEANTLVPPPYSRAASPEIGISSHFQQHFMIPRSASQVVCSTENASHQLRCLQQSAGTPTCQNGQQIMESAIDGNGVTVHHHLQQSNQMRSSESVNFRHTNSHADRPNSIGGCGTGGGNNGGDGTPGGGGGGGFITSQSDQHFHYITNSNSSLSDIFVNNSCSAGIGGRTPDVGNSFATTPSQQQLQHQAQTTTTINQSSSPTPLHRASTNPNQFVEHSSPIYNSCGSIGGISITVPVARDGEREYRDLNMLRRSLETCCQILQKQQQMPSVANFNNAESPVAIELAKKFEDGLRSYVTSTTCSAVSSLANIGTPTSPPQATSPTDEVKEILDQIRQLQMGASLDENALTIHIPHAGGAAGAPQQPPQQQLVADYCGASSSLSSSGASQVTSYPISKRPSTLQQSRKKFFSSKPNKAMYIPMMSSSGSNGRCSMKSPVSGTSFLSRGRGRKGWISRSAPTTPGTGLPPNRLGDDSPLLNEHDEDQEGEQNV
ncbi:uncharacterized protein LOC129912563 isoform X2 [Episyrphus balteatus]|uniref:uncharacterized protein LOC129912563 isoform X2 n=1 Tax=Episyrphus balteatus TaxID=286459 RepID=UPI0024856139|nr:uncharacterized protein LOC129912563 isoform X2 [Episyrphus balteatus]